MHPWSRRRWLSYATATIVAAQSLGCALAHEPADHIVERGAARMCSHGAGIVRIILTIPLDGESCLVLRGNPTPGRHDAVLEDGLEAQGEGVALTQSGLGRTSCDAWWARGHAEAAYTLPETQADLVVSGRLRASLEGLRTTRMVEDRIFAGFGCF